MLSIGFKTDYDQNNIGKISVILETASFIYGIFDQNQILVESGREVKSNLLPWLSQIKTTEIFLTSKSNVFTHIHQSNVEKMQELLPIMEKLSTENIFTCFDDEIYPLIDSNLKISHISTKIHANYQNFDVPVCFIHLNKTSILLCVCGSTGFKFFNEFEIESGEDILYFIKSVFQTLEIDEEKVLLALSGYIEEGFVYHKMLQRYFQNVTFASSSNFNVANNNGKEHHYFEHFLTISN